MLAYALSLSQALLARERAWAEFQDWEKREEEVWFLEFLSFIDIYDYSYYYYYYYYCICKLQSDN